MTSLSQLRSIYRPLTPSCELQFAVMLITSVISAHSLLAEQPSAISYHELGTASISQLLTS